MTENAEKKQSSTLEILFGLVFWENHKKRQVSDSHHVKTKNPGLLVAQSYLEPKMRKYYDLYI